MKPLIKYIGSKHKFAETIIRYFPVITGHYIEPFLGGGAILGHVAPDHGKVGDVNWSLIEMWRLVKTDPETLYHSYSQHIDQYLQDRLRYYEAVKAKFNAEPNPHDFLFISRTCYGGVIRFRRDGYLSTPVGTHKPISADTFRDRLMLWHDAVAHTEFHFSDYANLVQRATAGDVVYCDPPYSDSQGILYGAQDFSLAQMFEALYDAKTRGAAIIVSVDGTKKSGQKAIAIDIPDGLFETEVSVALGGSMLKRFSREGCTVEDELVTDRLLLSYVPAVDRFFPIDSAE